MSKIILITGGSRSGKSTFAEKLLQDKEDVLYIATAIVTDDEMKKRVERHKERRNSNWDTHEGYKDLHKVIENSSKKYIMLECIGTMVTDLMFDREYDFDKMSNSEIADLQNEIKLQIEKIVEVTRKVDKELIIVTNEVGWGLISEYRMGRIFGDIVGHINQFIGTLSDELYLVACGVPLKLKG